MGLWWHRPLGASAEAETSHEAGQPQPFGRLRITGSADAEVLLDGEAVGQIPIELDLAAGDRDMIIEDEGFHRWEGVVSMSPGESRMMNVRLGRLASGLHIGWVWGLATMALTTGAAAH